MVETHIFNAEMLFLMLQPSKECPCNCLPSRAIRRSVAVYNRFHFSVQSFGDVSALDKLPLLTHISLAREKRLSSR